MASSAGSVVVINAIGSNFIRGDILANGTGSGNGGAVTLAAPFVPTAQGTLLTVGNVRTDSNPLLAIGGSGGNVGIYAGSDVSIGSVVTSGYGASEKSGYIIVAADNTEFTRATGPGIITADNLISAGLADAAGGDITLDSGSAATGTNGFSLGSLVSRSTTGTNVTSWANDTAPVAQANCYSLPTRCSG